MKKLYPYRIETENKQWTELLTMQGIRPEKPLDAVFGIFDGDRLIATASYYRNIIKCVAIDPTAQGGSIFNELLSGIITEILKKNFGNIYVYTKPAAKLSFSAIGFKEIERVDDSLVFMESGKPDFDDYLNQLKKQAVTGKIIGSIVLNANPFTKGHRYLVETARAQCDLLHLFVVSEDASAFPQRIRKSLVEAGCADLDGIVIHDTRSYLVSQAIFPSYFLKENTDATKVQARLDARIFKYHIAKALSITDRFVGEEPFSPTTESYNRAMEEVFRAEPAPGNPQLHILPRKESDGHPISATEVRRLLAEGDIDGASRLVPTTTADYFRTEKFQPILTKLKKEQNFLK